MAGGLFQRYFLLRKCMRVGADCRRRAFGGLARQMPGLVTDDHCIVMVWADSDDDTNQPSAFVDDV
ncbi:MAG: hypothetical protein NTY46_16920 [Candidatus Sumerlaeota bacterium]|nr:hypothetical protein [Candidatus Sumerlaeota bacterium]